MPINTPLPYDYRCKCCGKIGFVFVEELGEYLCRARYLKYCKEQSEHAKQVTKTKGHKKWKADTPH